MEDREFYEILLAPVAAELGAFDPDCLSAIVGFDAGGPVNLLTIGRGPMSDFVTYVTCELAIREDQVPSELGRYELLITCDDEDWARTILTKVGQMTIDEAFGHCHTLDIGPWVDDGAWVQGLAFERFLDCNIEHRPYGVFRLHGLIRAELQLAMEVGVEAVFAQRREKGMYPRTHVGQRCE